MLHTSNSPLYFVLFRIEDLRRTVETRLKKVLHLFNVKRKRINHV